jgi:hypothetical protein
MQCNGMECLPLYPIPGKDKTLAAGLTAPCPPLTRSLPSVVGTMELQMDQKCTYSRLIMQGKEMARPKAQNRQCAAERHLMRSWDDSIAFGTGVWLSACHMTTCGLERRAL